MYKQQQKNECVKSFQSTVVAIIVHKRERECH